VIFVTIGTSEPFARLLDALEGFEGEDLVVQHGDQALTGSGPRSVSYLDFEELVELVREARVVVSHAGVGTILVALAEGKRPVVVPRLARFGEAVDDHQVALARRLDEAGFVTLVEDPADLPALLRNGATGDAFVRPQASGRLVFELSAYVASEVHAARRRRQPTS
jgi:UDP-N-acetylglucosamine transferase subunit ALG13